MVSRDGHVQVLIVETSFPLCSWTTTVGYGSLLLSANAGIRSFGLVAILGEATCLLAALTLAPALLELLAPTNDDRRPVDDQT